MDELAAYNKERWEALAQARIEYSRPLLDLDRDKARKRLDPQGLLGEVDGRDALVLAGGGGQDGPALALLGAKVTTFDLCETQLEREREAAAHYGLEIDTHQGDMRDLSRFDDDSFGIVYHSHSIAFIPDVMPVYREVARVMRAGGVYHTHCPNPFYHGTEEGDWNGEGYLLKHPYVDGAEVTYNDPHWDVRDENGVTTRVVGPREFRHCLSTLLNGLIGLGFAIRGVWEDPVGDASAAQPGSWEHFTAFAPPYLELWATYRPDLE